MSKLPAFKAYDIRGRLPDELNPDIAYRIGKAYAEVIRPQVVVVGHDVRLSSEELTNALIVGLNEAGVDVRHIGICGTEEVYFATFHYGLDGGIMVTASHNPMDYNGLKMVRAESRPISSDDGLGEMETIVAAETASLPDVAPQFEALDHRADYIAHLLSYLDTDELKPLKIVVNAGNGPAGAIVDALEPHLPFEFVKLHHAPDGTFPNGIPNPLLPENRPVTANAVREHGADLGVAWDGDFDRCFLFDERGEFVDGYYVVGMLAEALLAEAPGQAVIYDCRTTWNTIDIIQSRGGKPVQSRTGHAFIKAVMREHNAVYGGEMSAHHYFRDFAYCDNGNIPWLLTTALIGRKGLPLSSLVADRIARFPASGEINRQVPDPKAMIEVIARHYRPTAQAEDRMDGVSMEFGNWRFNLRASNTEPLLRLNVESQGDIALMREKTEEILTLVDAA